MRNSLIASTLVLLLLPGPVRRVAAQPFAFEDATASAGLTGVTAFGVAVADYDGDGWDDALLTTETGPPLLLHNETDGTFTNRAGAAGLTDGGPQGAALWADLDGDGLTDLFLGARTGGENRLYRNNGDGTFADVTAASGLPADAPLGSASLADYDGDGRLDLFLAVDRAPDRLFHNVSDGTPRFEDVSDAAGIAGTEGSVAMQSTWFDYDHDGRPDLYVVHDGTTKSRLHQNKGFLPLINVAPAAHLDDVGAGNSMGIAWFDFDGDGWEDVYVTRIGRGGLYRNNGDGTFTDLAVERGIDRNGMAWGVVPADFDNDGDEDVFIVNTSGYDGTPALLYRNDGGTFTEVGAVAGVAFLADAAGAASGDFNRDGRPDLLFAAAGTSRLLLNTTPTTGHFLHLHLTGTAANPSAVGVRVEVIAGNRRFSRAVSGGDSFCSQSSPVLHVGLGDAFGVDTLRIHWSRTHIEVRTALAADTLYHFVEPALATGLPAASPHLPFALGQNYPNPARRHTVIPFTLDHPAPVTLSVYDLLGRRVVPVLRALLPAGRHEVPLDASALSAGTYFIRLATPEGSRTRALQHID